MKKHLRAVIVGFIVGLVGLGSAFAGIVVIPGADVPRSVKPEDVLDVAGLDTTKTSSRDTELLPEEIGPVAGDDTVTAPDGDRTPDGTFLVGSARASLSPSPTHFGGTTWQKEGCTEITGPHINRDHVIPAVEVNPDDPITSLDDVRSWPATPPDCIYLGGFGIGPTRAAREVDNGGVWVRALAVSNGEETFAYAIADTVGWFARYDPSICRDCGIRDVRESLSGDLDIPLGNIVIGSTHTHAGADTYGGWGGIPKWYRNQIRDAAKAAVKQAVKNLLPATLTVGEAHLRTRNNDRRDTYYSNADTAATWVQAKTLLTQKPCETEGCTGTVVVPPRVIATLGTFAAHPTIVGGPVLHADWPGAAARRFEDRFGGVGLMFEGGLGNVSVSGAGGATEDAEAENTGIAIANDMGNSVPAGKRILSNHMAASVDDDFIHPVSSNPGLTTLASVGLFDREFLPTGSGGDVPGVYHWSKSGEVSTADDNDPSANPSMLRGCTTAGPSIRTTVGAHRIGSLLIAVTPGEIFSNIAEVIRERADRGNDVAMVLGQSNDALGYIIQSFEFDTQGNALTEYGTQTGEYEEVFAIDRCLGDHVVESLFEATKGLGFGG